MLHLPYIGTGDFYEIKTFITWLGVAAGAANMAMAASTLVPLPFDGLIVAESCNV